MVQIILNQFYKSIILKKKEFVIQLTLSLGTGYFCYRGTGDLINDGLLFSCECGWVPEKEENLSSKASYLEAAHENETKTRSLSR